MFVIVNEFILVCVCSSYTTGGERSESLEARPLQDKPHGLLLLIVTEIENEQTNRSVWGVG